MTAKGSKITKTELQASRRLTLLVDGSNMAYRAYYRFGKLHNKTMGYIGTTYGLYTMLMNAVLRFQPDHLMVFLDSHESKNSNFRLGIYPDYKGQRDAQKKKLDFDTDVFNENIKLSRKVLKLSGIGVVYDTQGLGLESDDYLAAFALKCKGKKLILSSDKDFFQLISPDISMFHTGKDMYIKPKNIVKEVGFTASEHRDFLILNGDTSDNIPGIKGLGETRIRKFLDTYGSIEQFLAEGVDLRQCTRAEFMKVYERNRKLIDLKEIVRDKKLNLYNAPISRKPLNLKKLEALLYDMGMDRLLEKYASVLKKLDANYSKMFTPLPNCKCE